ncbi:hypothetical protein [Solirubrobacter soli]|uniref:hypothetical protein n=1 Tax=Solirubrobacter soli TaxID=363832 RepID=UPI0003F71B7F|nr:hypothetical protein [Solirubrobacter soli]
MSYVEYGGLITIPSPYRSEDAVLHGFWAEADRAKLAALCTKVFAGPTGGAVDYQPLGKFVMITWGAIAKVSSLDPAYADRGFVWENQVAVWVPVVRLRRDGDDLEAVNLSWFVPYIWLDNPMSLTSGREVLGFAKTWGTPTFPDDDAGDGESRCTLKVFGLGSKGDRADWHPLLEVDPIDRGFDVGDALDSLLDVARHARDALGDIDGSPFRPTFALVRDVVGDLFNHRLNSVFLKQFPDVQGSTAAVSQQVVETAYVVRKFSARPLLGQYHLTVHPVYSQPVFDDLGLADQDLDLAYRLEMDFDVQDSKVLWP